MDGFGGVWNGVVGEWGLRGCRVEGGGGTKASLAGPMLLRGGVGD